MPRDAQPDHLTDYERVVCYYTVPRVTHPLTYPLIIAFTVCLFEALGALAIGLWFDKLLWTNAGAIALACLIFFGIVAFMGRAFLSDVRRRKALEQARSAPNAPVRVVESGEEIPNPFAHHLLLWRPVATPNQLYLCPLGLPPVLYAAVETAPNGRSWVLTTGDGKEYCTVRAAGAVPSFTFGRAAARHLSVMHAGEAIGAIQHWAAIREPGALLHTVAPHPFDLHIHNESIHRDDRLVGRIYELRGHCYLDVENDSFCEALVAFFAIDT